MKYTISQDRKTLTISVTPDEQKELREFEKYGDDCRCDASMHDFLEPLTANSELEWVRPEDTGDLTSAPLLGILGEERPFFHEDASVPHKITGPNMIQEFEERWGFQPYATRSPLEDLRDKGEAVFSNSW